MSFRNKQLEHRVASLQDDLSKDTGKKPTKFSKGKTNSDSSPARFASTSIDPTLLSDELQKKIIECAQLTSLIADKINEISLQSTRIDELEQLIRSMSVERTNNDDTLRKEIERLERKNHELETKLTEASSIVGSDDTLYVSECEQHQKEAANSVGSSGSRNSSCKMDDRLRQLEKENAQLRAQYEVLQLTFDNRTKDEYSSKDIDLNKIHDSDNTLNVLNDCMADDLIKEKFSKKIEELFMNKCLAETKLTVYIDECESLQRHLDIADSKLRDQERKFSQSQRNLQLTDEDLVSKIDYPSYFFIKFFIFIFILFEGNHKNKL